VLGLTPVTPVVLSYVSSAAWWLQVQKVLMDILSPLPGSILDAGFGHVLTDAEHVA